jgi:hypothetical protein
LAFFIVKGSEGTGDFRAACLEFGQPSHGSAAQSGFPPGGRPPMALLLGRGQGANRVELGSQRAELALSAATLAIYFGQAGLCTLFPYLPGTAAGSNVGDERRSALRGSVRSVRHRRGQP